MSTSELAGAEAFASVSKIIPPAKNATVFHATISTIHLNCKLFGKFDYILHVTWEDRSVRKSNLLQNFAQGQCDERLVGGFALRFDPVSVLICSDDWPAYTLLDGNNARRVDFYRNSTRKWLFFASKTDPSETIWIFENTAIGNNRFGHPPNSFGSLPPSLIYVCKR